MVYRQILTCLILLALIPLSAKAFPPASPAGGNYLVLDGIDDYAVGGLLPGYIDKARISAVARYDVNKRGFTPRGKFKKDRQTLALWHFDEPGGRQKFSDASGTSHHLVGEGGARTGIPLAVEARGKLTTTWGRLKQ